MGRSPVPVAVVGSVNEDVIIQADGHRVNSLGGVLFTGGALARLVGPSLGLDVRLVARIGERQLPSVQAAAANLPGLRLDTIRTYSGTGFRCRIDYDADGSKRETLLGDVPALTIQELAPCLRQAQALIVNFITGFEMDLPALQAARRIVRGMILMDLHSLCLSRDGEGQRHLRPLPGWQAWLACADVVQMNESEARMLGAGSGRSGAITFAHSALSYGPRVVVVTLSTDGAIGAWRDDQGQIHTTYQPACPMVEPVVDTTGCGDVFLAGLSARLLAGGDVPSALRWGALAAARKCTQPGLSGLEGLTPESMFPEEV